MIASLDPLGNIEAKKSCVVSTRLRLCRGFWRFDRLLEDRAATIGAGLSGDCYDVLSDDTITTRGIDGLAIDGYKNKQAEKSTTVPTVQAVVIPLKYYSIVRLGLKGCTTTKYSRLLYTIVNPQPRANGPESPISLN